jgi:hypothetical protein
MKHIKKKFNKSYNISIDTQQKYALNSGEKFSVKLKEENGTEKTVLYKDGDSLVIGYLVNIDDKYVQILEPNFSLVNFNMAQMCYIQIEKGKKEFINELKLNTDDIRTSKKAIHLIYNHTSLISTFVIMLFATIESFVNSKISKDATFETKKNKIKDYDWILNNLPTFDKIEKYLKIGFLEEYKEEWGLIEKLKEIRNSLIHLKVNTKENGDYRKEYNFMLNMKYRETLEAVRDFVNYHEPNLIEECGCGLGE